MHTVKGIRWCILWILVTLFFFIQIDVIAQVDDTDSSDRNKSEIRLLIELGQVMDQDKVRLQNLLNDSLRLEPLFEKRSVQYDHLTEWLDSVRNLHLSVEKIGIAEHQWYQLQDILDFLLERRRSNNLQLQIIRRKLQKEKEAMDFFVRGEMFNILEFTGQNVQQSYLDDSQPDSIGMADQRSPNGEDQRQVGLYKYNWRVVEVERALDGLRGKFDFLEKAWLLTDQLMELNHDDINIAQILVKNSGGLLVKLREGVVSLDDRLKTIQAADSTEELKATILHRIAETTELTRKLENVILKDSALIKDLETRIDWLTGAHASFAGLVEDAADRVESKERRLEFLRSPLAPIRMYSFLIKNGPRIVLILGLLFSFLEK